MIYIYIPEYKGVYMYNSRIRDANSQSQSPVNPYSTRPCDELLNLGYNVFCIHVFADVAQVGTDHVY